MRARHKPTSSPCVARRPRSSEGFFSPWVPALLFVAPLAACVSDDEIDRLGAPRPTALLTAAPWRGVAPLSVTLDATSSSDIDHPEAPLSYRFDFEGDGTFDTEILTDGVVTHRFVEPGRARIVVEVRGAEDRTQTASAEIEVLPNHPPVAALFAQPSLGASPLAVELDASASMDPDTASDAIEVRWDFDDDGVFDTDFGGEKRARHIYQRLGSQRASIEVRDPSGLTARADTEITVLAGADIDVDTNRDLAIDDRDEEGEELWSTSSGAILLANLDDDDGDGKRDGRDNELSGSEPADLEDLSRLTIRQHPGLDAAYRVTLSIDPVTARENVRIFRELAPGSYDILRAPGVEPSVGIVAEDMSRADLDLRIEAIRSPTATWDGLVTLTLRIETASATQEDVVEMRTAPVIFVDDIQPPEILYVMHIDDPRLGPNPGFYDALSDHIPPGVELHSVDQYEYGGDRWVQDNMQTGYQSMPSQSGPQVMKTYLNTERSTGPGGLENLVPVGLLAPNLGFMYPGRSEQTSLNYGGNLEVAPAHTARGVRYPFGRILVGGGAGGTLLGTAWEDHMGAVQRNWLDAQKIQGPSVELSTEWLVVGHIDEILLFIPDPNATHGRPWKVVISSPRLAHAALVDLQATGSGTVAVFAGRQSETTVAEILQDSELLAYNQAAQARIDSVRETLSDAMDLTDADFVEVPVLYEKYEFDGGDFAAAYSPGMQNLVSLGDVVFVPDPEGPDGRDGVDIWQKIARSALEPLGLTVHFVDVFESYHENLGEAHCGINVARTPYAEPWWELD